MSEKNTPAKEKSAKAAKATNTPTAKPAGKTVRTPAAKAPAWPFPTGPRPQ